ncbi:helix-turn-helix domain-containing protein [Chloroflexota bacterium]
MSEKRRRSQRQSIDLEQLKNDADSFLSWGIEDPTLNKLETYRLYQAGYAVADIAAAFGLSHGYLYEMWGKFKAEGTEALVDKRWGAAPRKRTTEREAEVLRAKALKPDRGDSDLAAEFGLERSTVYRLLQEHGLQDLHRVLGGESEPEAEEKPSAPDAGKKRGSK